MTLHQIRFVLFRSLAVAGRVCFVLVAASALSVPLGWTANALTGWGEGRQATVAMAQSASPPQAPLDPTATPSPEPPTPTPEPPTPTPTPEPEPPTPEPTPTTAPPPATATAGPPAPPPATATPPPPRPSATPPFIALVPTAIPTPPPLPPAAPTAAASLSALEQEMFVLHNLERAKAGIAPFRLDATLSTVARRRAQDMASKGYFSHTSPTGETAFTIMASLGYVYTLAGENIARNNFPDNQSAITAMSGFLLSSTHRSNLLDPRFTSIGVGLAIAADGMKYWAIVFSDR